MADTPDLTTYSDDDLNALRDAVDAETTRRTLLARIPDEVAASAAKYVELGGDKAAIIEAVDAAN